MATTIKSIPVLKAKEAKVFDAKVIANTSKKATINFATQTSTANKILKTKNSLFNWFYLMLNLHLYFLNPLAKSL